MPTQEIPPADALVAPAAETTASAVTDGPAQPTGGSVSKPEEKPARRQPDLFAIINAQCDLSSSPSQKRSIAPDSSVLLVPGYIHALGEAAFEQGSGFLTPFFVTKTGANGNWIEWNLRSLRTVEYGKFDEWLKAPGNEYERIARMRPLQALALQRELGDRNTRIGLPRTPPIYRKLTITMQFVDNKQIVETTTDAQAWAIVIGNPGSQNALIALTTDCLQRVRKKMSERITLIAAAGTAAGGRLTVPEVEAALAAAKEWQMLSVPFEFNIGKGKMLFKEMLVISAADKSSDPIKSSKTVARILVHFDKGEAA